MAAEADPLSPAGDPAAGTLAGDSMTSFCGSGGCCGGSGGSVTVTVAPMGSASEDNGGTTGAFKFTASGGGGGCGASPTLATANFTLAGTATRNVDYTGPLTAQTVDIPMTGGFGEKVVTFTAVDDVLIEAATEDVIVQPAGATANNGFSATFTGIASNVLYDNDLRTITVGNARVLAGQALDVSVHVKSARTGAPAAGIPLTIDSFDSNIISVAWKTTNVTDANGNATLTVRGIRNGSSLLRIKDASGNLGSGTMTVPQPKVDLVVQGLQEESVGTPNEMNPGAILPLNNDGGSTLPPPPTDPAAPGLVAASLSFTDLADGGTWNLNIPPQLRVYRVVTPTGASSPTLTGVASGTSYPVENGQGVALRVEGVQLANNAVLAAQAEAPAPGNDRGNDAANNDVGAEIELTLKADGKIVGADPAEADENEDYAAEKAAAGDTDDLGALPMGDGRADFPGEAYTNALMVVGTVVKPDPIRGVTFAWERTVQLRSWSITNAQGIWFVVQRKEKGFPDPADDTAGADGNDATPSPTKKIYSYDNSAETYGDAATAAQPVGDHVRTEKQFVYQVIATIGAKSGVAGELKVEQLIKAHRIAAAGQVAQDWDDDGNTVAVGETDCEITEEEVREMVGGNDPIRIAEDAND